MRQPLAIAIMAKYPTPGRVKTRLQPRLSAEQSADVQRAFLLHVIDRLGYLGAGDLFVCFDPPDAAEAFEELVGDRVMLLAQSPGDLSDRLAGAALALRDDYERVLFTGVDSPDVPPAHLLDVIDLTNDRDAAIAPTDDGGFWALGAKSDLDLGTILSGIEWSSGREYDQTLASLKARVADVGVGRKWADVDRTDDLIALNERLIGSHDPDDRLLFAQLKDLWPVIARDGSTT
jgi:uncharacterized protein